MNHIHAPVKTRRNRQGMDAPKLSALALAIGVALGSVAVPRPASAGPEGGQIVAGAGSITQSGSSTVVTQGSDRLGVNWQSFNVGQNESVRFDQPSSSSVALNRIFDQNPSQILGALDANGHVFLINPNGLIFGENARINVGALIASSLDISLNDFLSGKNEFNAKDGKAGLVVNHGLIKAATGGSVTLLGGAVENKGVIVADLGQVTLGAGAHAALDFDGDGLLYFAVDGQALANAQTDAAVTNSGTIQANGGQVLLSGRAAQDVISNVVNNTGVIRATRIENAGGVIQLLGPGGTVASSGAIDASGQGGAGGTVQMLGDRVGLFGNATVDVSGDTGGGLAQIGGSFQGSDPGVLNAQRTYVGAGASIDASARVSGDGGQVVLWSGDVTRFYGSISARGGAAGGNGGSAEVSGPTLAFNGLVDLSAASGNAGALLLDPLTLHIVGGPGATGTDGGLDDDLATPPPSPTIAFGAGSSTDSVSAEAIEGATGTITLQARNSIVVDDLDDNDGDGDITLTSGSSLRLQTRNDAALGDVAGGISFADPTNSIIASGAGLISIIAGTTDGSNVTNGAVAASLTNIGNLTAAGDIRLSARNNVTLSGDIAGAGTVSVTVDAGPAHAQTGILQVNQGVAVTGGTVSLTGEPAGDSILRGGAGVDNFVVSGVDDGTINTIPFFDFGSLEGLAGNDTFTFAGGTLSGYIDGNGGPVPESGPGTDTLIGANHENLWTINELDHGQLTSDADDNVATPFVTIVGTFQNIQKVTGGTARDVFAVQVDNHGAISGVIDGDLGMDLVDYQGDDFPVIARVNDTTNGNGVTGVENFEADGNATLFGPNAVSTWMIALGDNAGTLNFGTALSFDGFNNLVGGSAKDTFNVSGAGRITGQIDGGGDNTDIINYTGAGTVLATIDGTSNGIKNIETVTGSGDANSVLTGANAANTWNINGSNAGTVTGGSVPVQFTGFPNLTGGTNTDLFTLNGGTVDGVIRGGASLTFKDRLQADNLVGGNTWTINAADGGDVDGVGSFADIENVTGGTTNDTFNVSGSISGQIDGGAGGTNNLSYAGVSAGTVVTAKIGATTNGIANITSLTGNANTASTLAGADGVANTWAINGANSGNVGQGGPTMAFSSFNNVTGGNQNDTFNITGAGSIGGQINGGGGASNTIDYHLANTPIVVTIGAAAGGFTGIDSVIGDDTDSTLVGANGVNNWSITGQNDGQVGTVAFTNFNKLTGGNDADTFTLGPTGSVTGTIDGGANALVGDLLQARDAVNIWMIDAANGGTVDNVTRFAGIENVRGGNQNDTFNVTAGSISGQIHGGADGLGIIDDTVNYTVGGPLSVRISGTTGGIENIETVAGNADAGSRLFGADGDQNFWIVNGANAGNVTHNGGQQVNFTSFNNVTGGDMFDTFGVSGASSGIGGQIDGGGGAVNTLTYASVPAGTAVNVKIGATTNGIANISTLTGNANTASTLTGADGTTNTWTINGANSGSVGQGGPTMAFTAFNNVTGGNQNDTFNIIGTGAIGGQINGGGGATNAIDYHLANAPIVVTIGAAVGGFAGINSVIGNNTGSTLVGANVVNNWSITGQNDGTVGTVAFTDFNNITGGSDDDSFTLTGAGSITGQIAGGGQGLNGDTVNYAALAGPVAVQIGAIAGGIAGIETVTGNNNNSTLIGRNGGPNDWTVNNANDGSVDAGQVTAFVDFNNLTGGDQNDTFTVTGAGSISGRIDGGGGASNTVDYSGATAPVTARIGAAAGGIAGINAVTGNANSTLVGDNVANAWTVTGANAGQVVGTGTVAFTAFDNLTGGSVADTFTLNGGTVAGAVDGAGGANSLTGGNVANTFTVTAANAGTATGVTGGFTNIQSLTGNAQNDTFTLNGGTLTGAVNGGLGVNTLSGDNVANAFVVNAANAGTVTGVTGGFTNIQNLTGNALADTFALSGGTLAGGIDGAGGTDTLTGDNVANAFVVTAANSGTATGVTGGFSNVESLTGNAQSDTFTLNGGTLAGAVNGAGGTNTLTAGNVANTFTVTAANAGTATGVTGGFTNVQSLTGNAQNDTFTLNGGTLAGAIDGAAGANALTGGNVANTFTVTAANAGTATGVTGGFTNIQNLTGNALADTFTLTGGTLAGAIDGAGGTDSLTGDNVVNTFIVTAANGGTATGVAGGFSNVENLTGNAQTDTFTLNGGTLAGAINGAGGANSLTGGNVANTFTVTAANAGTATGVTGGFTNIQSLTGNAQNDTFTLNGGTLAGAISGAGGVNTLTGGNVANTFTVTAANAGTATGVTGGFTNIQNLTGNALADTFTLNGGTLAGAVDGAGGSDTLTGDNVANVFVVTAANGGTATGVAGGFVNVESLAGNAQSDTFTLNGGTLAGSVNGAGGVNSLTGGNVANTFVVTAANAGTATGVTGGFTNIQSLVGGAQSDVFTVNAGGSVASIDGASGTDVLDLSANAAAHSVALTAAAATGFSGTADAAGFAGIDDVRAGASTADAITGLSSAAAWTLGATRSYATGGSTLAFAGFENLTGGSAVDTFNVNTSVTGTLNGGGGNDVFTFANGVTATAVDGGAGTDVLDLSAYTTARNVTITGAGAADGFDGTEASVTGGFRNLDDVRGSSAAADVITGLANAQAAWVLAGNGASTYTSGGRSLAFTSFSTANGSSGADTFTLGAAGQTSTNTGNFVVNGVGGADTLNVAGAFTVNGGDLTLSNIQTINDSSGAIVTAGTLRITGATGGVGAAAGPFRTNVDAVNIQGGAVAIEEQSGNVTLDIDSGTAALNAVVVTGNATLGVLKGSSVTVRTSAGSILHAGAATAANIVAGSAVLSSSGGSVGTDAQAIVLSASGTGITLDMDVGAGNINASVIVGDAILGLLKGNNVKVESTNGSILHNGAALAVDVDADASATLNAPRGVVGTDAARVVVDASPTGRIIINAANGFALENVQNTPVSNIGGAGSVTSRSVNKAVAAGVGSVNAADDLVTIDWAGLDPNVALVDCLQPCVKLPADQSEDPGLAQIRDATKFLLIRTDSGWKMIPVFPREAVAAN